uniref:C2H2-type domain-containing protein n=1 Tax=Homalodisca liturata TaxID=320908 RepID=A0A1B6HC43_9HEMI
MENELHIDGNESLRDCGDDDSESITDSPDDDEQKEDPLDLTVHCEPMFVELEEEKETDDNRSLNLEEECVDPLEFLEVDQDSISESIESDEPSEAAIVEDTQLSHDGSHKDNVVHLSEENTQQTDKLQLLNDENKQAKLIHNSDGSSQQNHQSFNTNSMEKDMIKQDIIYDVIEECLPGKPPVATMCKKCGFLKNVNGSKVATNYELPDSVRRAYCNCANEQFKCRFCGKLIKLLFYNSHMKKHRESKNNTCQTCGKTFLLPTHLWRHLSIHVDDKNFFCNVCDKSFKQYKSLKNHRVSCTNRKFYKCSVCEESFTLKRALIEHLRKHEKVEVKEESFNCEICCIVFDNSSSKKEHIMEVHVAAQRFVCGTCGEAFVTESAMKRHKKTHTRSYTCNLCEATFTLRRELLVHRAQTHNSVKELRCRTCGKSFEQLSAFTEHRLEHTYSEDTVSCELCNKCFKDKAALRKHVLVHIPLSERSVVCDICNRSFCGNSALQKHIRLIHADSRPYTCEFCSKSFNQLCKLKYHIVIHASDKPVSCDVCNKAFSNDKDIKIHMRTHTGEKPFKCKLCGKSFRQRGHVSTHQLVHTKEKKFNCQVCSKSFGLSSSLKKHMKLHNSNILITNRPT